MRLRNFQSGVLVIQAGEEGAREQGGCEGLEWSGVPASYLVHMLVAAGYHMGFISLRDGVLPAQGCMLKPFPL